MRHIINRLILFSHFEAFLGALAAGSGTLLTMGILKLVTILSASFTNLGTFFAEVFGMMTATSHIPGCQAANISAIPQHIDALGACLYIGFL